VSLQPGSRLGPYEVITAIGAGGMGVVYRARDTRLGREVALKGLPDVFATDPDRLARFEREARLLASLNHPNIAQIHGLEESGNTPCLVLELVEGQTLAVMIAAARTGSRDGSPRGLDVDQALKIATQIAEALEAAHEKGVIHRDLKPANIKITPDATVKVLDFGLAKALDGERVADPAVANSPTLTMAATRQGIILGTAAYMSPEQARGQVVDRRADVWAFGCVLYEMLTGRAPFAGKDVTDILASVLKSEPDWTALPAGTPDSIQRLLRRCLEKNPKLRLREVGTAIAEIHAVETTSPGPEPLARTTRGRKAAGAWALGAAVGAALGGLGVWSLLRTDLASEAPTRLLLSSQTSASVASFFGPNLAISPDGRRVVYAADNPQGRGQVLYVRDLDRLEARRLQGTELGVPELGFVSPFFSPDGKSVGFRSVGKGILRVPVDGGEPTKILEDQFLSGAAWGQDDRLIVVLADGLYRVRASGVGSPERLVPKPAEGVFYSSPDLLPGERAVLFEQVRLGVAARSNTFPGSIGVLDLETREQRIILEDAASPQYVSSGHLLFSRGARLMVVPFDPDRLALTGEPVPLAEPVRAPSFGPQVRDFSVSRNGTLAYITGGTATAAEFLVWVDRRGRVVGRAVDEPIDRPRSVRISPDGRRIAAVTGEPNVGALWIYNLDGRPPLPLTKEASTELPVWSPDSSRIAFAWNRGGRYEIFMQAADGSSLEPRPLSTRSLLPRPIAWLLRDDLLFFDAEVRVASIDGRGEPRQVVASQFVARNSRLSPDERWLAFVSNRTGNAEVWVQAYPDGAPTRVSRNGGDEPVWSRDGKELFYQEGSRMMSVAIRAPADRTFTFDPAVTLFDNPTLAGDRVFNNPPGKYDIGSDGRFLMRQPTGDPQRSTPGNIVVVQNWLAEVRRLAPTAR
jgi:serine/threonine-protein kinase